MEKEGLFFSSFFIFLGIVVLGSFRKVFTGNFAIGEFMEYKLVLGISFYVGVAFLIFGLVLFLFYFNKKWIKRRKFNNH
jgi:hypothetical protein